MVLVVLFFSEVRAARHAKRKGKQAFHNCSVSIFLLE